MKQPIAEVLRLWRRRRGLTQEEAARAMGNPIDTYRRWEQGRQTPGAAAMAHIQRRLTTK